MSLCCSIMYTEMMCCLVLTNKFWTWRHDEDHIFILFSSMTWNHEHSNVRSIDIFYTNVLYIKMWHFEESTVMIVKHLLVGEIIKMLVSHSDYELRSIECFGSWTVLWSWTIGETSRNFDSCSFRQLVSSGRCDSCWRCFTIYIINFWSIHRISLL